MLQRYATILCALVLGLAAPGSAAPGGTPELFIPTSAVGLNNLSYSASGLYLVGSSALNNNVKVFDARSNVELRAFSGHEGAVTGVAVMADDETVVSGSEDGTLRFWSLMTGEQVRKVTADGPVAGVALSGDGRLVVVATNNAAAAGGAGSTVRLWDTARGEWLPALYTHDAKVRSVAISHDGRFVASGDADHTVKLWGAASGGTLRVLNVGRGVVPSLAFNGDATLLACGVALNPSSSVRLAPPPGARDNQPPNDGGVQVWDVSSGTLKSSWDLKAVDVISLAFHPDGKRLATGRFSLASALLRRSGQQTPVQLWDAETGREGAPLEISNAVSVAFNPDGRTLAAAGQYTLSLINTSTGRLVRNVEGLADDVTHLTFPRNDLLVIDNLRSQSGVVDLKKVEVLSDTPCHQPFNFGDAVYYFGDDRPNTYCSPDERTAARVDAKEDVVEILDADAGDVLRRISVRATSLRFSPDGRTLVVWTREGVEFRDVGTGESRSRFAISSSDANWNWELSPGGAYLLTNNYSPRTKTDDMHVYDVTSGRELYIKPNFNIVGQVNGAYHPKDRSFAVVAPRKVVLYEMQSGRELFTLPNNRLGNFPSVVFSPSGNLLAGAGDILQLWDAETGEEISLSAGHAGRVNKASFSPDGRLLATAGEDRTVRLWDVATRTLKRTLAGHSAPVDYLAFSPDGTRLATAGRDARTILWSVADGSHIVSFIRTMRGELIAITPDNYYHAPRSALPAVAFRVGKKALPAAQFDLKFNRPDLVLERLGVTDAGRLDLYRRAYERRLKKLNLDEAQVETAIDAPPFVALRNADFPSTTGEPKLPLTVRVGDAHRRVVSLNVLVNGVPVYGRGGLALSVGPGREQEQRLSLELGRGRNRVEIFAINEAGVESLRETAEVEYAPPRADKPDFYIAVVGVTHYRKERHDLTYAAKDADDVAEAFASVNRDAFNQVYVRRLLNEDARRENIQTLIEFLRGTKVDDEVVLFLSGHGLRDANSNYFFATHDIDFRTPGDRGVSYDELESLLDAIPARKKLLLLDTCHSGEADPGDAGAAPQSSAQPTPTPQPAPRQVLTAAEPGRVVTYVPRDVEITPIRFDETAEALNEVFADLRRGTGTAVISAAGAAEYAFESATWKNGVFTFSILSGLKTGAADLNRDDEVTAEELQQFVAAEVTRLTDGRQKPVAGRERVAFDFAFSRKPSLVGKLLHPGNRVSGVAWSPDGSRVATSADDGAIRVWKASGGEVERLISTDAQTPSAIRWTVNGEVAAGIWDRINFYDASTGELRRSVKTGNTYLSDFDLGAGEGLVLTNGDSRALKIYRVADGTTVKTFEKHPSQIWQVALSGDGKFMASGEANGTVRVWDAASGLLLHTLTQAHERDVTALEFYRAGETLGLVSAGGDGTLRFWDPASGGNIQTVKWENGKKGRVTCLAFSRDGRWFATGHFDGTVRLWRTADRAQLTTIFAHAGEVRGLDFSSDGQILATAGNDGAVKLWLAASSR